MKNVFWTCFIIIISLCQTAFGVIPDSIRSEAQQQTPVPFSSSNLPIIVINTNGQTIVNDNKIDVFMGIIYNGENVRNYLSDPFNDYSGRTGIEIRGSSSQWFPKKQYSFETRDSAGNDMNVSLLGLPAESDWVLYAPYNDKSLIRDILAYKLASEMGRYASRSKLCELVLNGEYMGVYVLLEKIKRNVNRVSIKKLEPADTLGDALTGGYIIKIDKQDGENNSGWYSSFLPFPNSTYKIYYQYHYPKPGDIVLKQMNYIKGVVSGFESMMRYSPDISDTASGYPKHIDVDSFVDFFILNEVVKNVDAYRLSTFLYKDRDSRNPRVFAGPVWDYNIAFGNADYYQGGLTSGWHLDFVSNPSNMESWETFFTPFWWKKLFDDTSFRNKVHARWNSVKESVFNVSHIVLQIDSLALLLNEAKERNFQRWPVLGIYVWPNYFVGQTYQNEINYLKSWTINRLYWLNQNMIGELTGTEQNETIPSDYFLSQNFPNPFNPSTSISFSIPERSFVKISIYDLLGKEVDVLINKERSAGEYQVTWNAGTLPSGTYFYRISAGSYSSTRKMILIK